MPYLTINFKKGSALVGRTNHRNLSELERLAELGRLSASLLHEISNPLSTALLHIENLSDNHQPAIKEARRSIRLIKRYVEAARQQVRSEGQAVQFKLSSQINQVRRVVAPLARQAGVKLQIGRLPDCEIYGDPVKFQQVLANLIVNAIEAYAGDLAPALDKPVLVKLELSRHHLLIEVIDCGTGIAPGHISQIFEPFFSTKSKAGKGLGIGLALVKQYVLEDFGGSIRVRSHRGHTIFSLRLPLKDKAKNANLVKIITVLGLLAAYTSDISLA